MYLARHTVIIPSATLMSAAANIRAASTMSRFRTAAWSRSMALNWITGLPEKNWAVAVSSGVRTVEANEPKSFDSLKSLVYWDEVSAGGGGGANWNALFTSRGVTKLSHGSSIDTKPGGVGRQTPGAGAWVKKIGASRPSWARRAIRLSAARIPKAIPFVLALPSGICVNELA